MCIRDRAGSGNSVFHPADFTILNRRVSKPRLGHAFSVHGLTGNLGWAAAPLVMTAVASVAGWRAAAFSGAAIALLAAGALYLLRDLLGDVPDANGTAKKTDAGEAASPMAVLRSPAVLMCFVFFFFTTAAVGAFPTFSPAALKAKYGLSEDSDASCSSCLLYTSRCV